MWRLLLPLLILSATVLGETELEEDIYEYAEDDVEERAFLVIQKKFLESEVPDGANMTLVLTVFNAGTRSVLSSHFALNFTRGLSNRAAGKVVVKDAAWPENVEILSDETTAVPVERLNPGLTLSVRTILRPLATGHLVLQPTTVTYAPTLEASEQQVVHSTLAEIMVLTTNEYLVSKILLMGSYVSLGLLNTKAEWNRFGMIVGAIALIFVLQYVWQKLSLARQERMRRKAREMLEKSK